MLHKNVGHLNQQTFPTFTKKRLFFKALVLSGIIQKNWKFNAKVRSLKFIEALLKTSVPTLQKTHSVLVIDFYFGDCKNPLYKVHRGNAVLYIRLQKCLE